MSRQDKGHLFLDASRTWSPSPDSPIVKSARPTPADCSMSDARHPETPSYRVVFERSRPVRQARTASQRQQRRDHSEHHKLPRENRRHVRGKSWYRTCHCPRDREPRRQRRPARQDRYPRPRLPGTIHTAVAELNELGGHAVPVVGDVRNDNDIARVSMPPSTTSAASTSSSTTQACWTSPRPRTCRSSGSI